MSSSKQIKRYGQFIIDGRIGIRHKRQYARKGLVLPSDYSWSPQEYINEVISTLEIIKNYQIGRIVLGELKGRIRIVPHLLTKSELRDKETELLNAYATNRLIGFSPRQWRKRTSHCLGLADDEKTTEDEEPDSVLLHEILHTIRLRRGIPTRYKVKKIKGRRHETEYEDDEEYYSILIENIYRSEKGLTGIVMGHNLELIPYSDIKFSEDTDYAKSLKVLKRQMPKMYRKISKVTCRFNPIRTYESGILDLLTKPWKQH